MVNLSKIQKKLGELEIYIKGLEEKAFHQRHPDSRSKAE